MSTPQNFPPQGAAPTAPPQQDEGIPPLLRGALWVAVGALIAAAIVCVVWVLLSPEGDVIPKAFTTILLLAGFGGIALVDANAARGRPAWFALVSMVGWVVILLAGLVIIWSVWDEWGAFMKLPNFVGIVAIVQAAVWHQRLMWKAHERFVTGFTRSIMIVTSALLAILVLALLVPMSLPYLFDYPDIYGRILVALTILVAVGTALIPLLNALFGPRRSRAPQALPWPTFGDGVTPLPMLPDGSPDFAAAQTGVPSPGARSFGAPSAPQAVGYAPAAPVPPASAAPYGSQHPAAAPAAQAPQRPPHGNQPAQPPAPPAVAPQQPSAPQPPAAPSQEQTPTNPNPQQPPAP